MSEDDSDKEQPLGEWEEGLILGGGRVGPCGWEGFIPGGGMV